MAQLASEPKDAATQAPGDGSRRHFCIGSESGISQNEQCRIEWPMVEAATSRMMERQRKNAFLATSAHELRDPLAPLRNGLEVLKRLNIRDSNWFRTQAMVDRQLAQSAICLISRASSTASSSSTGKRLSVTTAIELAQEMIEALVIDAGQSLVIDVDPTLEVHGACYVFASVREFALQRREVQCAWRRARADSRPRSRPSMGCKRSWVPRSIIPSTRF